jgi:hypothetical protein
VVLNSVKNTFQAYIYNEGLEINYSLGALMLDNVIHPGCCATQGRIYGGPSEMKNTIDKDCYFQHGYVLMLGVTENLSRH